MQNSKISATITGIGSFVPPKVVTNQDIADMGLDTSDEWISTRTGIKQRRVSEDLSASDLAYEAAKKAIEKANITAEDINLIIVATTTPDYNCFPSTACLVQDKLGAKNAAAFDLSAACSGFIYGITTASQFIETGNYKNILVIGVDTLSKNVNWEDRNTCILFGDGAGAVVMSPTQGNDGILSWTLGAKGAGSELLIVPNGGSKSPLTEENIKEKNHFIKMDGKAVFKFAVSVVVSSIEECLKKVDLNKADIDFLIPHQANKRIIDFATDRLGLSPEKVCVNIGQYGNTSAASIPLALDEAVQNDSIKKGDLIAVTGFGAGLTWGAALIKWSL